MDLSSKQLSSLKAMGIPVWEFRSSDTATLEVKELSQALLEQLAQCHCWVLLESQPTEQTAGLLHAMLFAIGLTATDFAVLQAHQYSQVQQLDMGKKVIFVLGEALTTQLLEQKCGRGEMQRHGNFSFVISHDLESLIKQPLLKADTWNDLRLVKNELLAC